MAGINRGGSQDDLAGKKGRQVGIEIYIYI